MIHFFSRIGIIAATFLVGSTAHAQGIISDTANAVAGPLSAFFGAPCAGPECVITVADYAITTIQVLLSLILALVIIGNGIRMVYSTAEEEQTKSRKAIGTAISGLVLAYLAPRFVVAFFTAGGESGIFGSEAAATAGAMALTEEIFGVIRWLLGLFAVTCIVVLIYSGIGVFANTDPEAGYTQMKRAIISVISAILLLLTAQAIKASFGLTDFGPLGAPSTLPVIARVAQIFNGLLGLAVIVGLAVVVYAGVSMILAAGDEDAFKKARSLIIRSGMGFIVILASYLVASFLVGILV